MRYFDAWCAATVSIAADKVQRDGDSRSKFKCISPSALSEVPDIASVSDEGDRPSLFGVKGRRCERAAEHRARIKIEPMWVKFWNARAEWRVPVNDESTWVHRLGIPLPRPQHRMFGLFGKLDKRIDSGVDKKP